MWRLQRLMRSKGRQDLGGEAQTSVWKWLKWNVGGVGGATSNKQAGENHANGQRTCVHNP